MRIATYSILLIGVAAMLNIVMPSTTWAAGCAKCGCHDCNVCPKGCGRFRCDCRCDIICEIKHATKKIEITCWECVCKKVCLAGKSCGCQGTCGKSRVVRHLIRKTIVKEVPIVKCEAVDRCGCTDGNCDAAECDARSDASQDAINRSILEAPESPPLTKREKKQGFLGNLFAGRWTLPAR